MMIVLSKSTYKSIGPIQPAIELPDFVVLSGLNGSGKSQLLLGIAQGKILLTEKNNYPLEPKRHVENNMMVPNVPDIITMEQFHNASNQVISYYSNYRSNKAQRPEGTLEQFFGDSPSVRLIQRIARNAGKDVDDLNDSDFYEHYPLEANQDQHQQDIFSHHLPFLFKRYHIKYFDNQVKQYRQQKGHNVKCLTDEEFIREHGEPPWLSVNKIIKEAKLDYHINSPENDDRDAPFTVKLINDLNGAEINFNDLSSGEKVIISLVLSLYNDKFDIKYPKVLLLDEPDSHLHPSMAKQFLDVVHNFFVVEKHIKVIMTTHSPSTIALAPEETLFIMNKTGVRITKESKDKALGILTSGVPTLSINYENRRQVFVESKYDVAFYEKVYEKLKDKLVPEISINFIPSGTGGQGSCEQVKEIVNALTRYGNRTIYGIVDWDTRNSGSEFVKVLGKDKRYSIENYIFDPIVLAAFLFREKFIDRSELGLAANDKYIDFNNFDGVKLQAIADHIVDRVKSKVGNPTDIDLKETEYMGGKKVKLPSWFLKWPGHPLETLIKEGSRVAKLI